jgi:hypothetical protein
MAPKPLAFVFEVVLAMAVTILTTWAAPSNHGDDSVAPIPPCWALIMADMHGYLRP